MLDLDRFFVLTLQHLPEIALVYDEKGQIRFANEQAFKQLGYSEASLLKIPIWEIDHRYLSQEQFARLWNDKTHLAAEKTTSMYRCSDARLLPVELSSSLLEHEGETLCLLFVHNMSDRVARENELRLLYSLIDDSHDMIYVVRLEDGYIHYMNKTAERDIGYTLEEQRAMGIESFRRPLKSDEPFAQHLQELKASGKLTDYAVLTRKDGSEFPIEVNARSVNYNGVDYNIAIVRDISERVEAEAKLQAINTSLESMVHERTRELEQSLLRLDSYQQALNANSIVSISDLAGRITYVNENFCKVSGYRYEELIGKPHSIVRHPDTPSTLFKEMWQTIAQKKTWLGILKNRKKDGGVYYVEMAIQPILGSDGEIVEYMAVRHEITQIIQSKEAIKRQAYTDELTGMGSRLKLIEDTRKHASPMLAYIDINGFNNINDFYGHEFGDRMILNFSKRIASVFRHEGALYRLHGDQFAVLADSNTFARFSRLLEDFVALFNRSSLQFEGQEFTLRITASLSCERPDKLISSSDLAMRYAKKQSKPYVVYTQQMGLEEELRKNLQCTHRLQRALSDDRIEVFCQPIADTSSREHHKYECLVRLIEEDGSVISPFFFLEAAKRSKQYGELSKAVIRKSFELIDRYPDKVFSINITIDDILNDEVVQLILMSLKNKVSKQHVIFELVESEGIENFAEVTAFVNTIKASGCKLSIDDFGTGYSNFEYLLRLNADFIKIDGSLIKNIDTDDNIKSIVELIIGFAKRQNIQTVAEFVESESIAETMSTLGVDYLQGYHIGKPERLP